MLTPLPKLTCPNCGAKLASPPAGATEVVCDFCSTRFAIAEPVSAAAPATSVGSVILAADFQSDALPGWALTEEISVKVGGGELQVRCPPAEEMAFVLGSEGSFDDIDARVVVQWDSKLDSEKAPAWAGLALRDSDDGYYVAALSSDGLFSIYWYSDEDSGALVDDSEHPAIKKDGPNHLRFVAHDAHLKFYVNGALVSSTRDDGEEPFTDGAVALVVVSTEQPAALRFRQLELREVP